MIRSSVAFAAMRVRDPLSGTAICALAIPLILGAPVRAQPMMKGDGVTDDTEAVNIALRAIKADGVLQLDCAKSYYFGGVVDLEQTNVTLRHCAHLPGVIYGQPKFGMPDSILEAPHIILGPHATFRMARGGGLENSVVFASSIKSMKLPDTRSFVGTALTQASGGLGDGIHARNLVLLGFSKCYDGSNGGSAIDLRNILCDAVDGFLFGTSLATSHLDGLDAAPYLTAAFEGYRINSIKGNGVELTLGYTGPAMALGHYVNMLDTSIPGVTNNVPFKIVRATGSAVPTSASTVTIASSASSSHITGFVQDYDQQYLRGAYGFRFVSRSDDTHFGSLVDFGHDVSLDVASAAFLSGDHLWCDNNRVACIRNVGHEDLQLGEVTATTVASAYLSVRGAQPVSTSIGQLFVRSAFSDCLSIGAGTLFVGHLDCAAVGVRTGGYAVRVTAPDSYVMIPSGQVSKLALGVVASSAPADRLLINVKWTDAPAGASIFGTPSPELPKLPGTALIRPTPNSDKFVVTGDGAISSIDGAAAGRELTLECEDACVFSSHGSRYNLRIMPKKGERIVGPGVFRFWYSTARSAWLQE